MIAGGLLLFVVGALVVVFFGTPAGSIVTNRIERIGAAIAFYGLLVLIAGVCWWLWKVAP